MFRRFFMKKRITKIFGIVLAISIGATIITACGGNVDAPTESTSSQTELVE